MSGVDSISPHGPALVPMTFPAMAGKPLVSVLMSNYNLRVFLGEAIESVQRQTYAYWELIVCDDGSADGSAGIVREYQRRDARIHLIEKSNGGQSSGFNAAYQKSTGQIVCLLDSDDVYLERKIECLVQAFQQDPGVGIVAHPVYRVDVSRRRHGRLPLLSRVPDGWLGEQMLGSGGILENLPPGLGLSIRREVAERIFPLREQGILRNYGDAPIMRLAPLICRIKGLEEPLAEWRQHDTNHGNTRHLTAEYVDRELRCYAGLWEQQRDYLTAYCPEVAARLMPLEAHPHVAEMGYARARLSRSAESRRLHGELMEKLKTSHGPLVRKLFWQCSSWLPGWLFSKALDTLATQGRMKRWLSQWKQLRFKAMRMAHSRLAQARGAGESTLRTAGGGKL